ncbi:MAG: hypothetical protein BGP16_00555 [Sphingobium sp. 66-54]|nr:MAG: hypothetical protein BGP16_00555 [Sphingobium sp. 66-54]
MGGVVNIILYGLIGALAIGSLWGIFPFAVLAFFTFYGAAARVAKASDRLSSTLMEDEDLQAEALQHRVFALFHRRAIVGITNSRVVVVQRGLLGGFKMLDIQWKDLEDVTLEENVLPSLCGSNLKFKHSNKGTAQIEVKGVESDVASVIYSKSQSQEQAWEEKRRIRRIEEVRAAAGGVVVNSGPVPVAASQGAGGNRMLEEITKAKALLDAGAISDAEFQEMKAKILAAA